MCVQHATFASRCTVPLADYMKKLIQLLSYPLSPRKYNLIDWFSMQIHGILHSITRLPCINSIPI